MTYIKSVRQLFQVNNKSLALFLGAILGGSVIGFAFDFLISHFSGEMIVGFGILLSGIMFAILVFFGSVFNGYSDFAYAVYNGCARTPYIFGKYIYLVIEYIASLLIFGCTYMIEAHFDGENVDFIGYIEGPLPKALLIIFAAPAVVMLFSALYAKFERKFFWFMWGLYMIIFIGGPRIITAMEHNPESMAAKIGFFVKKVFSFGSTESIVAAVVLFIIVVVADILIYRNVDVRE